MRPHRHRHRHRYPALLATLLVGACTAPARPPSQPTTLRALYGVHRITSLDPPRTALVLVDFQEELFTGRLRLPDGRDALRHAEQLLAWARRSHIAVVHVRNLTRPGSPLFAPDSPTSRIVAALAPRPDELVITKPTGGAFTRTDLDATLRARGIDTLVVAGLMTHLAVAMTAQDAAVLGYAVLVAGDATATRDLPGARRSPPIPHQLVHRAALAAIADRFADVLPTREIVTLPRRAPATSSRSRPRRRPEAPRTISGRAS